jgi:transcriptional regulator GlxA family with amidase domain
MNDSLRRSEFYSGQTACTRLSYSNPLSPVFSSPFKKADPVMDSRVQKIIVLLEGNPHRALSLREMALTINLSVPRLRLLFKAATGMSPTQYFKLLKMRKAKSLLETTFLTIKEIAAGIGIKDVSHFVRDFKKAYGMSPAQYRESFHSTSRPTDRLTGSRNG